MAVIDPFVLPEDPTAAEAIAQLGEALEVFDDWMDRYQYIIELGRKLPPFPPLWADDDHRVPGCQSRVWMEAVLRDGELFLAGASDAAIVSGLVAMLLRVYSGRTPQEILATEPVFLKEFGLLEALSTNRGNGVAAMARRIRDVAAAQMPPPLASRQITRRTCGRKRTGPSRAGHKKGRETENDRLAV